MMKREEEGQPDAETRPHERLSRAEYRDLDDGSLIDAMRREDPRAIEEFIIRAQRVIHDRAQWSGLSYDEYEDCAVDVVDDVALLITTGKVRPSQSIAAYVMKVFRTRIAERAREARDRSDRAREAANDDGDARRFAAVSEGTWRSSLASGEEGTLAVSSAVARLAELVEGGITLEERRILHWLSNYIAQRDICEWLGVSYAAGTQRLWRLRDRLKKAALAHAWAFTESERKELQRFLRWTAGGAGDESSDRPKRRDIKGANQ